MEAGGVLLSFPGCSALRSHRGAVPPSSRRRVTQVIGISVSFPGKRPHTGHRAPLNEIWAQRQGPGGLADLQICTMCVHTQASVTVSAHKSLHMCACLCARMCLWECAMVHVWTPVSGSRRRGEQLSLDLMQMAVL